MDFGGIQLFGSDLQESRLQSAFRHSLSQLSTIFEVELRRIIRQPPTLTQKDRRHVKQHEPAIDFLHITTIIHAIYTRVRPVSFAHSSTL